MALLHHVIEIAERLMGVQKQRKVEARRHHFHTTIGLKCAVL